MKNTTSNQTPTPKSLLEYPDAEKEKLKQVTELMSRWITAMKLALPSEHSSLANGFVTDGFYPHYFSQPLKILFVGRESRGLHGLSYLDIVLSAYREGKRIGKQHLNRNNFNSRLLHVAWGLLHDFAKWDDIPWAAEIGNSFATNSGISFAFMNLSKLSNESDAWQLQRGQFETSISASVCKSTGKSFIEEEIALLEPDVIVLMNLGGLIDNLGSVSNEVQEENVTRFKLRSRSHCSELLDTWHFSAPGKKHDQHFYEPICRAIKNAISDGWMGDRAMQEGCLQTPVARVTVKE